MSYVLDLRAKKSRSLAHRLVIILPLPALKRRLNWFLIAMIVLTAAAPIFDAFWTGARYDLRPAASLLSQPNQELASKLKFDSKSQLYQFNPEGRKRGDEPSLGSGQLYSADFPAEAGKPVTLYDNLNQLQLSFAPNFGTLDGKTSANRLVYPQQPGNGQLVYTLGRSGVKEDIVLAASASDNQSFSYNLNLPTNLEAKLLPAGAVGIYSADPALYGNISFGSDTDRQTVEQARAKSAKDHLAFLIPVPVVKQSGRAKGHPVARFELNGNTLTVRATGLAQASYPLSIDPSFVVTSASDFQKGNHEGGTDLTTDGQLGRGLLTGGTTGSWSQISGTNSLQGGYYASQAVVINGYIYAAQQNDQTGRLVYAPMNSDGTIGTFSYASHSYPNPDRSAFSFTAYNGYVYISGGCTSSVGGGFGVGTCTGYANDVQYAKVQSNGDIGTWTATTSFSGGRLGNVMTASNGYLYVAAGCNSFSAANCSSLNYLNDVQFAKIKADGTVGSWTATSSFTTARWWPGLAAYNGNLYLTDGVASSGGTTNNQYAQINSDGTLTSWTTTTSNATARSISSTHGTVIYNGYIYLLGGTNNSTPGATVEYAPINADGSLGMWRSTSGLRITRSVAPVAAYKGYLYIFGGCTVSNCSATTDVDYAKINTDGALSAFNGTNTLTSGRFDNAAAASGNCLYSVGGNISGNFQSDIQYATISTDGSVSAWASTIAMTSARSGVKAVAYGGNLYVLGGQDSNGQLSTVQHISISSNCTLSGSWTNDTGFNGGRWQPAVTTYNGYLYVISGQANGFVAAYVSYTKIQSDGTLGDPGCGGTWCTAFSGFYALPSGRYMAAAAAWNGYVYIMGGKDDSGNNYQNVLYAKINSAGQPTDPNNCGIGSTVWCNAGSGNTASNMSQVRFGLNGGAWNGYLYASAGCNGVNGLGSCSGFLGGAELAKINSDGTLGSWTTSNQGGFGSRYRGGGAFAGGYIYNVGGCTSQTSFLTCNGQSSLVDYAPINNGGPGTTGTWSAANSLSNNNSKQGSAIAIGNCLYYAGGNDSNNAVTSSVQYATINPDNGLGAWTATSSLPNARNLNAGLSLNGYIYVFGGNQAGDRNDVFYAKPNNPTGSSPDCTIPSSGSGSWKTASGTFATAREQESVATFNGYVYILSGCSGTSTCDPPPFGSTAAALSDVQYAKPDPTTGDIPASGSGSWTATTSVATGAAQGAATAYNGYLYFAGGCISSNAPFLSCSSYSGSVIYAKINSNGTLGSWQSGPSFATPRMQLGLAGLDGYLYAWGGYNGVGLKDVQVASVAADGSLSPWQTSSTTMANAHTFAQFPLVGSRLAAMGSASGSTQSVELTTLNVIPRTGRYSRLLDCDLDCTPTKLLVNGSLADTASSLSNVYANATNSSPAFGSTASLKISFGTPAAVTTKEARYWWLSFTIDDSAASIFPDSTQTTITDFNLYYHPAPAKRLRGGKTFTGQSLQSLDASP